MDKHQIKQEHEKEYRQIGLIIAYYRKYEGLTQLELAEKLDISRTHLSNIEACGVSTSLSLELLFKLSDVLDIEMKDLFDFRKNLPFLPE